MSRVQDDHRSAGHYSGARAAAGRTYEECNVVAREVSSDSDSDSDSDYYDGSSSDSDIEVDLVCRSVTYADAKAGEKAGDHYDYPRHRHRHRHLHPVEAVGEGAADATVRTGRAVVNTALLRPDRAAVNLLGAGSGAAQAVTLGVYDDDEGMRAYAKAGASAEEPKKAGAAFGETCFMGAECTGCPHPACTTRRAAAAEGSTKKAGCGECGGHKSSDRMGTWTTTVASDGKKSRRTSRRTYSSGKPTAGRDEGAPEYRLQGVHSGGKCVACLGSVKRAGAACKCGSLRSVAI